MKKIASPLTIAVISWLFLTSAHKSIWPNSDFITNEEKYYCNQFQFLNGSNRTADFKKVFEVVFKNEILAENKSYSISEFEMDDILKIFGNPTEKIGEEKYIYNLNPDFVNCKVIFQKNIENSQITCFISNCK